MEPDFVIDKIMNNPVAGLFHIKSSDSQFHQPLGTWSMHVESWLNQTVSPVHVVRYEDMKARPFDTFKRWSQELGSLTQTKIFNLLLIGIRSILSKNLKKKQGFREKLNPDSTFFLHGKVGHGVEVLTPEQIERIRTGHSETMKRLDYG